MTDTQTAAPPPRPAHAPGGVGAPWSLKAARDYLGVSERKFRDLIRGGQVKTIKLGVSLKVPDAEVRRLAVEGT